ncbi:MAG: DUF5602 domain-containing protein [Acidobacteriota bacterium]
MLSELNISAKTYASRGRSFIAVVMICLLSALGAAQHASHNAIRSSAEATAFRAFAGEPVSMGNGTARSWVTVDKEGKPVAVGATFTESSLSGLPQKLTPGLIWVEHILPLPADAPPLPFDHIGLNWNPRGHDPEGVYNVPHFDFHFYMISPGERDKITTRGDDLARCRKPLPEEFVPEGYIYAPASEEPGMGAHWVEPGSHEFHGAAFTHTFIYGSYDGRMIFLEPMIARSFLETRPNITVPIKLPRKYQKPGYYPARYSVSYKTETKEYTVALEGLTYRQ